MDHRDGDFLLRVEWRIEYWDTGEDRVVRKGWRTSMLEPDVHCFEEAMDLARRLGKHGILYRIVNTRTWAIIPMAILG